jgi:hypothetical protein
MPGLERGRSSAKSQNTDLLVVSAASITSARSGAHNRADLHRRVVSKRRRSVVSFGTRSMHSAPPVAALLLFRRQLACRRSRDCGGQYQPSRPSWRVSECEQGADDLARDYRQRRLTR